MDVLKEFETLTAIVREFVQSFDEEYDVRFGSDFMALLDEDVVVYTIAMGDTCAGTFRKNFLERFPACECLSVFTMSILHEIGHLETEWDMEEDTALRNDSKITDEQYYALHNEWIATQWAGEWATANLATALAFDRKFQAEAMATIGRICD